MVNFETSDIWRQCIFLTVCCLGGYVWPRGVLWVDKIIRKRSNRTSVSCHLWHTQQRNSQEMWWRQRQKMCQSIPSAASLTLTCPSPNTYPIPNTSGRLQLSLTECTEMANHGWGSREWGSHLGSATKPVLTVILWGTKRCPEAKRGRKEEDTEAQTLWKMEEILAPKAGKEDIRVTYCR